MRVDVSPILKEPGASIPFDLKGRPGEINLPDGAVEVSVPLTARGVATSLGDSVYVEANVRGSLTLMCSRCLSPFERPIDLSCEGKFVKDPSSPESQEDEVEVFPLEGACCDLDEMIRHEIVLAIPMKPLCSEECKGFCPVCGKNLNEGDCGCLKPQDEPSAFGRKLLETLEERGKKHGRP